MLRARQIPKSYLLTTLGLLLVVTLVAGATYFVRERARKAELNEANATLFNPGPIAAYVDMQGNPVSLAAYQGSILIVNAWASWSPYSVEELPLLESIADEYKDKKVVVLAINRKEGREQADRFLSTLMPLPHVRIIVDTTDFFYGATGGYAMPETLIYNQAGTIVEHLRGTLQKESLKTTLDSLLTTPE